MKISVRRLVGCAIVAIGLLLFFDVEDFFTNNPSWYVPVRIATEQNIAYLLIVLGVFTIFASNLARIIRGYAPDETSRLSDGFEHESVEERRRLRLPLERRHSALADRGVVGGALLLLLLIPMFLMLNVQTPSKGIYARLPSTQYSAPPANPTDEPIIVTVRRHKDSPSVFLNGKEIHWQDLEGALKVEFVRRSEWTVFVEGDEDLNYADVMNAVDMIYNVHGKAVLLTPKMRQESAAQEKPQR